MADRHPRAIKALCSLPPFNQYTTKIKALNSVVNKVRIEKNRDEISKQLRVDGFAILIVGLLIYYKGIATLTRLMPDFLKNHDDYRLLIIGDGPTLNARNSRCRLKR